MGKYVIPVGTPIRLVHRASDWVDMMLYDALVQSVDYIFTTADVVIDPEVPSIADANGNVPFGELLAAKGLYGFRLQNHKTVDVILVRKEHVVVTE